MFSLGVESILVLSLLHLLERSLAFKRMYQGTLKYYFLAQAAS